jgi:2-dehydro-3-deoxyphosphogluconate aldolase/(4S)-4-hydroxy-2-oxoglutarate aldolase
MAVLAAMIDQGVIPVFYRPDVEVCKQVIQACANGGAKCIEFTNRGDFAASVFLDVTRHFAKADPSVIMGVGSIVDAPTAGIFIANGAKFVVGPLTNPDVAKVCNRRKIPYSPGCGSASEIGYAEELGCEIVKVFPGGSVGGQEFVKSMLGPCPWTRIMPTGAAEERPRLAGRGPDIAGRRGHVARDLARLRRPRPQHPHRPRLHREGLRHPRRARLLGPRPLGGLADQARGVQLGEALRRGGRALVPHRRHLRGAGRRHLRGGGDGFASGLAYGFLEGKGPQAAVEYGAAHGALAMTTPGDTSMVRVEEVEAVIKGKGARVVR